MTAAPVFPATGTFQLGQLTIVRDGAGAVVHGPGSVAGTTLPPDSDAIRSFVSQDATGRYRPLAGARSLPSDWQVVCDAESELTAVVDVIYPLAPSHIEQWRGGTLRLVSLDVVLARQTARYAVSNDLTPAGRAAAVESLCSRCVKQPVWLHPSAPPPVDAPLQVIPCPEPCSVLVSLCREAALWEKNMPPATEVESAAPFADFETPGNEVREDCLARMRAMNGAQPQHG